MSVLSDRSMVGELHVPVTLLISCLTRRWFVSLVVCQSCVTDQWCLSYVWQVIGSSVMCDRSMVGQLCVEGQLFVSPV